MKKVSIIVFFSIIAIILSATLGWFLYEIVRVNEMEKKIAIEEQGIEDECTDFAEKQEDIIQTNASEFNLSPNSVLIFKTYYKDCEHTEQEIIEAPSQLVNLREDEVEEYYKDWILKGFSNSEVVFAKEIDSICNKHYQLKENEAGMVSIYHLEQNGEAKWLEDTDINVEFLPEEDRTRIENGLEVIGEENLNKIVEDFE